ncbi:MAG: hypothetical protein JWQ33_311 [Ramlibacter sp.]|nr:hypothetical protein [Ramlibacter sp.]
MTSRREFADGEDQSALRADGSGSPSAAAAGESGLACVCPASISRNALARQLAERWRTTMLALFTARW